MDERAMADRYRVLEELGSGSFGVVYKGIEKDTGDVVAIKHIDLESSDDDIQDIQQEISVLSTCNSPFVTQYKASFLRGCKLWIIMEYLGGGSCLDLLKSGPFSEVHIAIICREILLGLDYLHKEGKIHRDIKAANILLAQSGKVKLADFGVAAQLTNIKSQRNTFVGTPFWMAPEVIQQAGYDFKADIWSLGVTAMEMIHGEPPNASTHPMKVLFLIPKAPAPRLEGNNYSQEFKDFVAACLVKDPDLRPTASELLQHCFIRNAGSFEGLRELVQRRHELDSRQDRNNCHKFYAESMSSFAQAEEKDDWVFDTIRPSAQPLQEIGNPQTQKLRRMPTTEEIAHESPDTLLDHLSIGRGVPKPQTPPTITRRDTVRKRPSVTRASSSAKRRASGHRQPLGLDLSFGNGASNIRQFRRVSGQNIEQTGDDSCCDNENHQPTRDPVTKEASLGRRAYSKAVNPAFEEAYAQTGSRSKRDQISCVALAWDALNKEDAEGEYHLLRLIIQNLQSDPKLAVIFSHSQPTNPQKPKLFLAQNNPHLKSHRRRQSSLLQSEDQLIERSFTLPGQLTPGMEHLKQLADVLYSKWTEGLKNRWPEL